MKFTIPDTLSAGTCAVRTSNLTKEFGKQTALDAVNFTIPDGSFYVLVGPNGAGKTTFLKLLMELIRPTSGTIDVLGMNPLDAGAAIRAHVGYIPERSDDVYSWKKVSSALAFHARYFPTWDGAYAAELCARLSLKDGKLSQLSKGEVRRVQIVMALAHRPPLLLLDEPTDGLDPVGREIFRGILAEHIATSPTTVLVSTHLVFEIETLADHFAVLRDGRLLTQLRTDELQHQLKRYVLTSAAPPPADVTVMTNGSDREKAWTLWGDETELRERLIRAGAELRAVRPLTLQEAAVALLSQEDA